MARQTYTKSPMVNVDFYGPENLKTFAYVPTYLYYVVHEILKNMVSNSLHSTTKKFTNHSARKTLVKKLKSSKVPKSEIIGITGHNSEAGLDAYDSGDE